mgnify:CR=1 FL=1
MLSLLLGVLRRASVLGLVLPRVRLALGLRLGGGFPRAPRRFGLRLLVRSAGRLTLTMLQGLLRWLGLGLGLGSCMARPFLLLLRRLLLLKRLEVVLGVGLGQSVSLRLNLGLALLSLRALRAALLLLLLHLCVIRVAGLASVLSLLLVRLLLGLLLLLLSIRLLLTSILLSLLLFAGKALLLLAGLPVRLLVLRGHGLRLRLLARVRLVTVMVRRMGEVLTRFHAVGSIEVVAMCMLHRSTHRLRVSVLAEVQLLLSLVEEAVGLLGLLIAAVDLVTDRVVVILVEWLHSVLLLLVIHAVHAERRGEVRTTVGRDRCVVKVAATCPIRSSRRGVRGLSMVVSRVGLRLLVGRRIALFHQLALSLAPQLRSALLLLLFSLHLSRRSVGERLVSHAHQGVRVLPPHVLALLALGLHLGGSRVGHGLVSHGHCRVRVAARCGRALLVVRRMELRLLLLLWSISSHLGTSLGHRVCRRCGATVHRLASRHGRRLRRRGISRARSGLRGMRMRSPVVSSSASMVPGLLRRGCSRRGSRRRGGNSGCWRCRGCGRRGHGRHGITSQEEEGG